MGLGDLRRKQKMFDYSALLWKTNHTHDKDEGNDNPADEKGGRENHEKKKEAKKEKVRCLYTLIYTSEDMKRDHRVGH